MPESTEFTPSFKIVFPDNHVPASSAVEPEFIRVWIVFSPAKWTPGTEVPEDIKEWAIRGVKEFNHA
jgi:hypothetical protein